MGQPQQPEIRRSETTPALTPDAMESQLEAEQQPSDAAGHEPSAPSQGDAAAADVPDQPDSDDVADAFGTAAPTEEPS